MPNDTTIYSGGGFDVDQAGDDWKIWRFCNDDGDREQIIFTTEAMDELRDYFATYYAEDRGKIAEVREP